VSSIDPLLAWYHKAGAVEENPEVTLFSLEQCVELKTFEFGPTLRHVFDTSS
jgi:hypothetical protein